jgi:glycosyltransferase involved in cell wall biosynthesis
MYACGMRIWILQTGEPLHIDSAGLRPMRAMNLSNALVANGHRVVLWSSDFDHFSKKHRTGKTSTIQYSENLEIRLISSRGYKSHVGLSRLFDHAQLAFNLRKELKDQNPPDVAFIGYPPIETAWVMTNWLFRRRIPTLLDVKDAWPDVLLRAFPTKLQLLAKIALIPYFFIAKNIFKKSTGLCSVTQPFLDWSLNKADRSQSEFDFVAPLTTPLANFNDADITEAEKWLDAKGVEDDGRIRGSFVGTLNSAFDFQPIIEAAILTSTLFVIAGDGPEAENLKASTFQIQNIIMLGWINSVQAHVLSKRSSFMLAPLKDLADFKMSVPNKFYDAMAHGLPIVTSITGFAKNLVIQENIGITYSDSESLCKVINKIESDLLDEMSTNSLNLYKKNFSFQIVYSKLINHLKNLTD